MVLFAALTIIGITESSRVAIAIFLVHLSTLALVVFAGILYLLNHGAAVFTANLEMPTSQGLVPALFFGFSAATLGISGFENSANFVEEQKPGVFPKTLRNMWAAVMILFPVGNVLLKIKCARLPTQASWLALILAIPAVTLGLLGNALMNPPYVRIFLEYFIPSLLVIAVLLGRITLLKASLFIVTASVTGSVTS